MVDGEEEKAEPGNRHQEAEPNLVDGTDNKLMAVIGLAVNKMCHSPLGFLRHTGGKASTMCTDLNT